MEIYGIMVYINIVNIVNMFVAGIVLYGADTVMMYKLDYVS